MYLWNLEFQVMYFISNLQIETVFSKHQTDLFQSQNHFQKKDVIRKFEIN